MGDHIHETAEHRAEHEQPTDNHPAHGIRGEDVCIVGKRLNDGHG